ncbi:DUF3352 domain-containing protein [Geitlerinema sp. PCC 7407]|uniref:DUF3352 domain-containing protein n=1 Tax=Geitlerinema sp. PCC 7407 TaxID=1173025 RepID=UPI00030461E1|nr:DUF3352 domain-containing protein [Geitlerinema sp. PCC 7407]
MAIALLTLHKPMPEKEKKRSSILLTLSAAVLLIGGGAVAYWLMQRRPVTTDLPPGSAVIPEEAIATISLSTDAAQWDRLRAFGTPKSQKAFDTQLTQWRDRLFSANGYNFQRDIRPWVGREITVAVLASAPPGEAKAQTGSSATPPAPIDPQSLLWVMPIANPERLQPLLNKPPKGEAWSEETYKEIPIKTTPAGTATPYAMAKLGEEYLVVSTSVEGVQQAIDTFKGDRSLVTTPGFVDALANLQTPPPIFRVYLNVPALATNTAATLAQPFPPQAISLLRQNQGMVAHAVLQEEGVLFQGVSWLRPDSDRKHAIANDAGELPSRLPANTLMMLSDGNFQRLWESYEPAAEANPNAPFSPSWLKEALQSTVGLDWEKDFLSWMEGEASLALVPTTSSAPPNLPVGLMFLVEASDRSAAEETMAKLDSTMAEKYRLKVNEARVNGQPVVNWTSEYGAITVTHGWLSGNVGFFTLGVGDTIAQTINPEPAAPLSENSLFQRSLPSNQLQQPFNGRFFIDVDRTLEALKPWVQLPESQRTFIEAMRTIGITAAIRDGRNTRFDILLRLKKVGEVRPLPSPTSSRLLPDSTGDTAAQRGPEEASGAVKSST